MLHRSPTPQFHITVQPASQGSGIALHRGPVILAALLLFGALAGSLHAAETSSPVEARVLKLSDAEKQNLAAKVAAYRALEPAKQQQLTALQQKIEAHPEAAQLNAVLANFHAWFQQLPAKDRADFRKLTDDDERLAHIRHLLDEQRRREWRTALTKLSPQDEEAIFKWVKEFAFKHKSQFMNNVPNEIARRLESMTDENKRLLALTCITFMKRMGSADSLRPTRDDFLKLKPSLSADAIKMLDQQPDEPAKQFLVHSWVLNTLWKRAAPEATDAKLQEFAEKLPLSRQEGLDRLQPSDREKEVRMMYLMANFIGYRPNDWNEHPPEPPPYRFGPGGKGGEGRPPQGKGGGRPFGLGDLFRGGPPEPPPPEK